MLVQETDNILTYSNDGIFSTLDLQEYEGEKEDGIKKVYKLLDKNQEMIGNPIVIDETKTTLTDYCKETIEKRLISKLNIFQDEIENIIVKLSGDSKKNFFVKLIVNPSTHSNKFIAMASNKDLFEAIDIARNKIYSQISKLKKRFEEKRPFGQIYSP